MLNQPISLGASQSIILAQSKFSRALNIGFTKGPRFVPGRLNLGSSRAKHTYLATVESLNLKEIQKILKKYPPQKISTISILREALACNLGSALEMAGISDHYGDSFIGVTHLKGAGGIRASYQYENIEGLAQGGLWIIADSICKGRNLVPTLKSLLSNFSPQEIIFICPIASSIGIATISKIIAQSQIPVTFIAWGALFGVDEQTLYDMPWGHQDTQAFDPRDQQTFLQIYGPRLCVGGDFGNDYYCPPLARELYQEQLKQLKISPKVPTPQQILKIYRKSEILEESS